jgi:hypothetical protein
MGREESMRDRRDLWIAALAAALLFSLGLHLGRNASWLPSAQAQDGAPTGFPSGTNSGTPGVPAGSGGSNVTPPRPDIRPGFESRTGSFTGSDSNSNNRFVAVTTPIGSGESVTFVLDAETEQMAVYRFLRGSGLMLVAARKIDYDLKLSGFNDRSEYSREELKALFEKELARNKAQALKGGKEGQ